MVEKTFTRKVKDEIERHVEKNLKLDLSKASFDKVVVKKDLRVKFLRHGTIYNPENGHHLEYSFKDHQTANTTIKELALYDIEARLSVNNQDRYIVYIVDEDTIMNLLKLLGADSTYKEYKKIAKKKSDVKKAHALVNFEAANIKKAANAGLAQLDDIKTLLKKKKFEYLDDNLKEVIKMRQKYPYDTLSELAIKLGNVSKSALNHRFIKIRNLVKEL